MGIDYKKKYLKYKNKYLETKKLYGGDDSVDDSVDVGIDHEKATLEEIENFWGIENVQNDDSRPPEVKESPAEDLPVNLNEMKPSQLIGNIKKLDINDEDEKNLIKILNDCPN